MAIGRDRYVIAFTMEPGRMYDVDVPLHAQRLLRFVSDLDGDQRTSRGHVAVKTAMEKEQVRERERSRRKTRCSAPFT